MKIPYINFVSWRKKAALLSALLLVGSLLALLINGLELGLDFTGGTLVEVKFNSSLSLDNVRLALANSGFDQAIVQEFGGVNEVLIRVPKALSADLSEQILNSLRVLQDDVELRRVEFVGARIGSELREQAIISAIIALGLVLIYVAFRFQLKFGVGAVAALVHDVIITLGFFSLFQLEFDLSVLAAILAIIGYSLNDTIVVADRVRENFRDPNKFSDVNTAINDSLNQVIGRTIITSFTTLLVLIALLLFGGEVIRNFATALVVGVLIGTYSSIYIAINIIIALKIKKEDVLIPISKQKNYDVV